MKNKYIRSYIHRGLVFGGLGPIVLGIVLMCISFSNVELNLEGWQILLGIVSTYLLAFIQAGSSVFEQIEEWSSIKSLFFHLLSIYLAYLITYLVNNWIPFNGLVILIFSLSIIVTFLLIWLVVYIITNKTKNKLNSLVK